MGDKTVACFTLPIAFSVCFYAYLYVNKCGNINIYILLILRYRFV